MKMNYSYALLFTFILVASNGLFGMFVPPKKYSKAWKKDQEKDSKAWKQKQQIEKVYE